MISRITKIVLPVLLALLLGVAPLALASSEAGNASHVEALRPSFMAAPPPQLKAAMEPWPRRPPPRPRSRRVFPRPSTRIFSGGRSTLSP